jgi:hypothetical protein
MTQLTPLDESSLMVRHSFWMLFRLLKLRDFRAKQTMHFIRTDKTFIKEKGKPVMTLNDWQDYIRFGWAGLELNGEIN